MKIGIDISQIAYGNTGVANYLSNLIRELVKSRNQEYVLFFSSLRRTLPIEFENEMKRSNVRIRKFKLPLTVLDLLWNKFHIFSIEKLIGDIDIFMTSDWTEPPARRAKKATIIYDLTVYRYPDETDQRIVSTQKKKLEWVKKESSIVFCISESTRKDIVEILGIDESKVHVIYPGISTV